MHRTLFLALLLMPLGLRAQDTSLETRRKILVAQDSRDVKALSAFLKNKDPFVRGKAAFAAGSVQDTLLIHPLASLLTDSDATVRRAAAFALGQMNYVVDSVQRLVISSSLSERLFKENTEKVILAEIEALGKIGESSSLGALLQMNFMDNQRVAGELALSIGRYAYRGIRSDATVKLALGLLASLDRSGQWKAVYALMRIGDHDSITENVEDIVSASHSGDADTRMLLATVLGKMKVSDPAETLLRQMSVADTDWRVRVNAVRALGGFPQTAAVQSVILSCAVDPNAHVSIAALTTLRSFDVKQLNKNEEAGRALVEIIGKSERYLPQQRREAAVTFAKLFGKEAYPDLHEMAEQGTLARNAYTEALGHIPTDDAFSELIEYAGKSRLRLKYDALQSIQNWLTNVHGTGDQIGAARMAFVEALDDSDLAVLTIAASALGDSLFVHENSVIPLTRALNRLRSPDDVEPMVAIIATLGSLKSQKAIGPLEKTLSDPDRTVAMESARSLERITGHSYVDKISPHTLPLHTVYDWEFLYWISEHPDVEIATSKGTFLVRFLPDAAPFTCLNIGELIRRRFYNRLTFHRVVPNFVIQGGDPRGDGWGGPGFAMRSEFSYEHYDRGMVGVASAGKDTEGSQFFVTHSKQPHLDGRYTIFGEVIQGMDVVDRIQIGDTIESVTFTSR